MPPLPSPPDPWPPWQAMLSKYSYNLDELLSMELSGGAEG